MLQKSKKAEMIKELEGAIKNSQSLVFVNFHGLKVSDETVLRRELRDKEIGYKVSRKTLLVRALKGKAEGEIPELTGEVAIAYSPAEVSAKAGSQDPTASAREIYSFQKTHKVLLNIIGGIFKGKFLGKEKMMEIAMIPSREVLYAQFVNLINSPIQRFAVVLDQIAKSKS
ncbi:TPA: 50S ribosomal protein L10 [Candidatus Nomurabacteria bacterium]|uniref:Large ribosomal subunit protein uL10 n=2 Tax=Candidatus Nomuraibacteriota TaxID=1752729 RepID=A0A1F6YPR0_9BACT|nr:MAG: 50S ribosomal protein L10 [Candidatus Nomurabacteria bacterium RIFOXYB1_FULL_43_14]OGJ08111.1 MAG: 50S ribosomal protein L10 [Candidatus Nomurabacteria bacterium RIFOXYA1_FULL_42_12]OGJ08280.1 MAG: 50S ribosomal protein L10 [Candidatus Nomurabacteria bacterium RIFOXYA2_FULL_42_12]OGJ09597.1 MAG: 50S ribosomal protein L10 [Candidatus Nomurabacteria bacterium RIFOXYC2_FULL_43_16]OGJ12610.1 MAG: 50S ribosomal protein L10 [Candidatus Nomurabacteria bacterium RIFOXYC1_FULL_43_8]OGJ15118.1 M